MCKKGLTVMNKGANVLTRPDQTRPDQNYALNYGVALLKIWMSFQVVLAHFWHAEDVKLLHLKPFATLGGLPVTVFMFIAFIFSEKFIVERNSQKLHSRLFRLIVVHVSWTLIYFVFYLAGAVFAGKGTFAGQNAKSIAVSFLAQLFLGSTINPPMWFHIDLIILTLAFWLIFYKFPEKTAFILLSCCVIFAVAAKYTGLNFLAFGNIPYAFNKYTLGRLCEMIPVAGSGLIFARFNLMEKLSRHRTAAMIVSVVLGIAVYAAKFPVPAQGFMYQKIYVDIAAILMTIFFWLLPFDNISSTVKRLIAGISRLTLGVYCMHMLVGTCIMIAAGYQKATFSFVECLMIYAVCLAVGFILSLILGKNRNYLIG